MFGYIRPLEGELKVREQREYRGYYCGLCKSIGARYGQIERLSLSYDCAFLAALLALARVYWFRIPFRGILCATMAYSVALGLRWA